MNKSERIKILQPHEKEKLFMPNEIFNDLTNNKDIRSAKHIPFAYCYYGLISYLYRYCKYGSSVRFSPQLIKQLLGYSKTNKHVDYIMKKDGLLDKIGYTRSERNFPISWTLDNSFVEFFTYIDADTEFKRVINLPKNFKIKAPLKGIHRTEETMGEVWDGTFYSIENTHKFDIQLLIHMVSKYKMGTVDFYLYQFFKNKNDAYNDYYYGNEDKLVKETGIPKSTLAVYVKDMEKKGLLQVARQKDRKWLSPDERIPNGYKAKSVVLH